VDPACEHQPAIEVDAGTETAAARCSSFGCTHHAIGRRPPAPPRGARRACSPVATAPSARSEHLLVVSGRDVVSSSPGAATRCRPDRRRRRRRRSCVAWGPSRAPLRRPGVVEHTSGVVEGLADLGTAAVRPARAASMSVTVSSRSWVLPGTAVVIPKPKITVLGDPGGHLRHTHVIPGGIGVEVPAERRCTKSWPGPHH
jgi:hypothetical protein